MNNMNFCSYVYIDHLTLWCNKSCFYTTSCLNLFVRFESKPQKFCLHKILFYLWRLVEFLANKIFQLKLIFNVHLFMYKVSV